MPDCQAYSDLMVAFPTLRSALCKPIFDSADDFDVAEDILKWFTEQVNTDEIENVTDEMVDNIVAGGGGGGNHKATGVIFCECNNIK